MFCILANIRTTKEVMAMWSFGSQQQFFLMAFLRLLKSGKAFWNGLGDETLLRKERLEIYHVAI